MTDKQRLRAKMRAVRAAVTDRARLSETISRKAVVEAERLGVRTVLSYESLPAEVDTSLFNRMLAESGFTVCLPKMTGEYDMIACRADPTVPLVKGRYGFDEPANGSPVECELAFVPLVAFDRNRCRLGQGKGCYDRYLKGRNIRTVGLAFSCQMTETVYPEAHDIPLDKIITELFELE